jgi:DNA-binding IclR family transcriptional regulator
MHATTKETVTVSVFDSRRALIVDCIDGDFPVRAVVEPGVEIPLHVSAAGKAYLAAMPPDRIEQYFLTPFPLESLSPFSMTDQAAIRAEIDQIRRRGYSVNAGESHSDIVAVGAVADGGQGPVAGLVVAAPRSRVTAARTREFGELAIAHAESLSATLGGSHPG